MRNYIHQIGQRCCLNRFWKFTKIWGWALLAVLLLLLCIDIEFEWIHVSCNSCKAKATNQIILALSYSYIAAAIFHLIVNVIPYRKRKKNITPFLRTQLFSIMERLRLCKTVIIPFEFNKVSKDEFCKKFSNENLHEKYEFDNNKTKYTRLEELRFEVIDGVNVLLTYREYFDDDLFELLNKVLNSEFIINGIFPFPDVDEKDRIGYDDNQSAIGRCIYDLHEHINHFLNKQQ